MKFPERNPPEFTRSLFWDLDYDNLEWPKMCRTVVERTIERGWPDDWKKMFDYYGQEAVLDEVRKLRGINAKAINYFHIVYGIPLEDMVSWHDQQRLPKDADPYAPNSLRFERIKAELEKDPETAEILRGPGVS